MTKIPPDDILEGSYKKRIRESEKLKTVLELHDLETHQKKLGPDYHRLKTMAKRSIEQEIRNKNFGNRIGNFERTPWSKIREQNSVYKEFLEIVGNGRPTGSVWKETIAVSATISTSVEKLHHQIRLRILSCSRMSEYHREPEVPEEGVPAAECLDGLARITLKKGTCNNSFCEKWHPPECLFYKTKSGCRFGEKCSFAHRQVDEQPTKRSKKEWWQSAVALLKKGDWHERRPVTDQCHDRSGKPDKRSDEKLGQKSSKRRSSQARQLGCVFQDMTPPKSILRKGTDMRKPIQRVKFTKAIARHTKIRDQNPSLGNICPGEPHQRSPNAPKFEDQTVARARCSRSSVEAGQKCVKTKGAWKSNILLTFGR